MTLNQDLASKQRNEGKEIAKCSLEDSNKICADFESSGEH